MSDDHSRKIEALKELETLINEATEAWHHIAVNAGQPPSLPQTEQLRLRREALIARARSEHFTKKPNPKVTSGPNERFKQLSEEAQKVMKEIWANRRQAVAKALLELTIDEWLTPLKAWRDQHQCEALFDELEEAGFVRYAGVKESGETDGLFAITPAGTHVMQTLSDLESPNENERTTENEWYHAQLWDDDGNAFAAPPAWARHHLEAAKEIAMQRVIRHLRERWQGRSALDEIQTVVVWRERQGALHAKTYHLVVTQKFHVEQSY